MIYLLGIPGLIPFYLCFYNIDLLFLEFDKSMFIYYSSVILSFLGAVYWGVYLQSKNIIAILFSVCPTVYAFFILAFDLKFQETIGFFIAGYFVVLCFDFFFYFKEKIIRTDYFILRLLLTAGIAPAHIMYLIN